VKRKQLLLLEKDQVAALEQREEDSWRQVSYFLAELKTVSPATDPTPLPQNSSATLLNR
jgi:hypothetical protein